MIPTTASHKPSSCGQVSAGAYATAGMRGEDAMEDRNIVATGLGPRQDGTLLAVFDGHRGPQVCTDPLNWSFD